jgi:hypothetical protein
MGEPTVDVAPTRGLSWGLERRLQFIDFRLRWEGRLNRNDLVEHFGLSIPQASIDIAKYIELVPDNLRYDRSSKSYVTGADFKPMYQRSSARSFLAELLATKSGLIEMATSFLGMPIEADWAPTPLRALNERIVEMMVRAIKGRLAVSVSYQSMSSLDAPERVLSPHALGYFVLARILSTGQVEQSTVDPRLDAQWQTVLPLVLVPHPDLPPAQKRVIELDYGMQDGQAELPCRQAFLYYTMRRLGLHVQSTDPQAQQITLKNREEIQPFLDAVGAQS